MFKILFLAILLSTSPAVLATAPDKDCEICVELLRQADAPRRRFLNSVVTVRAVIATHGKAEVINELELRIGAEDQLLILFKDRKGKNRKFLTRGDKSWLLVPGAKHPIAISANQKLLGNLSFADMARVRLANDYSGRLRTEPEPCSTTDTGTSMCRVMDINANARTAPYASGTLWLDERGLVVRAVYALASGKLARAVEHQYAWKDPAWLPKRSVIDNLLAGKRAQIVTLDYLDHRSTTYSEASFDPEYVLSH